MFMAASRATYRHSTAFGLIAACVFLGVAGCEDTTIPPPTPSGIDVVSGDAQYTRKGTELEEPVIVRVTLADGEPAAGVDVRFQVTAGGGHLSRSTTATSSDGKASVRWTMGPAVGENEIRVSLVDNSSLSTTATATSSEFYCPEEDPTFARKFSSQHNLFIMSRAAGVLETAGTPAAGLVRVEIDFPTERFAATAFARFDESPSQQVAVRDCAFAASGDFYGTRNSAGDDVVKFTPTGAPDHFAAQESVYGSEIAGTPEGILVGCDRLGPFAVTCRDTLYRFELTPYTGEGRDACNNDAAATDPATGDLYFIYLADRWLRRLPLDGMTPTGSLQKVCQLEQVEADNARGMVVDASDGSIYVLVESSTVKAILKVTSGGTKTTEVDFFTRGAGDAAGQQDDLAIDRSFRFLYTLDTKNNVILLYELVAKQLHELVSSGDPHAVSNASSGERVGIAVLP